MNLDTTSMPQLVALRDAVKLAIAAAHAAEKAGLPFSAALDVDGEAVTITFSVEIPA